MPMPAVPECPALPTRAERHWKNATMSLDSFKAKTDTIFYVKVTSSLSLCLEPGATLKVKTIKSQCILQYGKTKK